MSVCVHVGGEVFYYKVARVKKHIYGGGVGVGWGVKQRGLSVR